MLEPWRRRARRLLVFFKPSTGFCEPATARSETTRSKHASTVLRISIATVIGPTPPGTGETCDAHVPYVGRDVATPAGGHALVRREVGSHVDDHRAALHPVCFDQARDARRRNDDVGLARHAGRDRRVLVHDRSVAFSPSSISASGRPTTFDSPTTVDLRPRQLQALR